MRAVERADGGVSIVMAVPPHTDAEIQASLPHLAGRPFVDLSTPPNPDGLGRRFRDAWRLQGGVIVHDVDKVRGLRFKEFEKERVDRGRVNSRRPGWRSFSESLDTTLEAAYQRLPTLTTLADILAYNPVWPPTPNGWF